MRFEKIRFCGLVLLLGLIAAVFANEKTKIAEQAAIDWLTMVDSSQYEASWNEASSLFRQQISSADWSKAVTAARTPLGISITRKLLSATHATSLPGAPDGEYVVLQFQTVFKNKIRAFETVTSMLDGDQWRVAGYYVR